MKSWKKIVFLCLLLPFTAAAQIENFRLSDSAKISIITLGPGQDELYSAFGHSAIRVHDPEHHFDAAFNYGVFDFNQPHFYLNFARGYLYYKLGVHDYNLFEDHYIDENRYVHEQILNLTPEEKQKVMNFLSWNSQPENEHYRYDYFYENCATKMPAVIKKVLGDSVVFDESHIRSDFTIRDLTDLYLTQQPWGDLGIDIFLGWPMDKVATPYEYMFLPDYVELGFDHATIIRNGTAVPLVEKKLVKNVHVGTDEASSLPKPLLVFSLFAILTAAICVLDVKKNKISRWFDGLLFGVTGLLGVLLVVLWLFTDHAAAARNLNILWALPTHLVAAIALLKNPSWLRGYFGVTFLLSVGLLISWTFLPQHLHYALIPVVVAIGLRSFLNYKFRSR